MSRGHIRGIGENASLLVSFPVSSGFGGERVPVKILRDTGLSESHISRSVLPFFFLSVTDELVLVHGINLNTLTVPLHNVYMDSDLVVGDVVLGVRPALPLEGVSVILGNKLGGGQVWARRGGHVLPVVQSVTAVTRSAAGAESASRDIDARATPFLAEWPQSISRSQLGKEQLSDPSLQLLFERAKILGEGLEPGYKIENGILMRRCPPHKKAPLSEPVSQVVVPFLFRTGIMKVAHDNVGHMGFRKTYDRVLRSCYWPRLKKGHHFIRQELSYLPVDRETEPGAKACAVASHCPCFETF